jgi:hypothetical protein
MYIFARLDNFLTQPLVGVSAALKNGVNMVQEAYRKNNDNKGFRKGECSMVRGNETGEIEFKQICGVRVCRGARGT